MFFEQEHQKYTCPITGAHFEPKDLCRRLNLVKAERDKMIDVATDDGIERNQKLDFTLKNEQDNSF